MNGKGIGKREQIVQRLLERAALGESKHTLEEMELLIEERRRRGRDVAPISELEAVFRRVNPNGPIPTHDELLTLSRDAEGQSQGVNVTNLLTAMGGNSERYVDRVATGEYKLKDEGKGDRPSPFLC